MVITKYIIYAVIIAFVSLAFLQPQKAQAGIASISSGLGLIPVASKGIVSLFQPFWEIKNLISAYGGLFTGSSPSLSNAAITKTAAEKQTPLPAGYTLTTSGTPIVNVGGSDIKSSSISWSSGAVASNVPLSSAARNYYSSIGVKVTT